MQELSGTQYMQCEIACKHDKTMEKKQWWERIEHFKEMDFDNPRTFKKASNPIGLRAAKLAYDSIAKNEPSGYMISLDACSSGLQILSLLVSCPKSWDLCGGRSDACVDSYTTIYDGMNLHGALTRKQVKNAIMTSLYGSVSMPEYTFGENIDLFYDTIESMAPGAWQLNLALQELWDEVTGSIYDWIMPDNYYACIETKEKMKVPFTFLDETFEMIVKIDGRPDFHKGLGPNLIHSVDGMVVREMLRRCMYKPHIVERVKAAILTVNTTTPVHSDMVETLWDRYQESGFLSVRILDYLKRNNMHQVDTVVIMNLIDSLPRKPFELVTVHDCFRCHPNYGNDVRRQYNTIMADINDSNILQFLASQVAHEDIKTTKVGNINRDLILEGEYLLA